MSKFNWQTDIVTKSQFELFDHHHKDYGDGRMGQLYYYCEAEMKLFPEDEVRFALYELTEDELKVCLFRQPMLMDIVLWIMEVREQFRRHDEQV